MGIQPQDGGAVLRDGVWWMQHPDGSWFVWDAPSAEWKRWEPDSSTVGDSPPSHPRTGIATRFEAGLLLGGFTGFVVFFSAFCISSAMDVGIAFTYALMPFGTLAVAAISFIVVRVTHRRFGLKGVLNPFKLLQVDHDLMNWPGLEDCFLLVGLPPQRAKMFGIVLTIVAVGSFLFAFFSDASFGG